MGENNESHIKLVQGSEHYDLLLRATGDAIWDSDMTSGKTYVLGTGYKSLFGYNIVNEFTDAQFWESRLHPDEKESLLYELEEILNDKKITNYEMEYRFLKANSSYAYVRDRFLIIRENGKAIRMIGAKQDITKQKEEEQRLKLLESVIANASDSVMILESVGEDTGATRIVYVNEAFTGMTGYVRDEVIGENPALLRGPETSDLEYAKYDEAIRDQKTCDIEIINYKKNGNAYWAEVTISPVVAGAGNIVHFIVIEKDITGRKMQEQEREKLISELTQNNIDLKQFSYITSHNLRGPIASLLGLCTLLDHFKIDDPTLKQILDGVQKATHMFDDTIKDLTTVLNVRDRISIPRQDLQFFPVFEKSIAQSEVLIDYCGAEIKADFTDAPTVNYNKAYLESIFSNLITNAIKYRSLSRKLQIFITTEVSENYIILKFSDNGVGIDLDLHGEKIFRLYQRFHDQADGKGLGLFLIKSQLEALNGSIDVQSRVGEGTTFILKFKR